MVWLFFKHVFRFYDQETGIMKVAANSKNIASDVDGNNNYYLNFKFKI
jgi:hypothetical protein